MPCHSGFKLIQNSRNYTFGIRFPSKIQLVAVAGAYAKLHLPSAFSTKPLIECG